MADRISLRGIRGFGYHGVYPEETASGQEFLVDLELDMDLGPASTSDDLATTVHYGEVAELVVSIVEGSPFALIERLAGEIAARVLERFPLVDAVQVTVHKPEAPVGVPFEDIAVTIKRGPRTQDPGPR